MSLFGKDKKELPPLLSEADLFEPEEGNYLSTLNYLIGLSDDEFDKVIKVAGFHRKAYQESAAVLGTPNEPTTFIMPPESAEAVTTDEPEFLTDDEPKATSKKRNKQIAVKE